MKGKQQYCQKLEIHFVLNTTHTEKLMNYFRDNGLFFEQQKNLFLLRVGRVLKVIFKKGSVGL